MRTIVWVNRYAREVGGCERYIAATSQSLSERGFRNVLLYDPVVDSDCEFLACFDEAYPLVDPAQQVRALRPDLLYLHQWHEPDLLYRLSHLGVPTLRFVHDQQLSCLRGDRLWRAGAAPCDRKTGAVCYACPGFVKRTPHLHLKGIGSLRDEQMVARGHSRLLVASDYMAQELVQEGFSEEQISVIPLFAEPVEGEVRRESDLLLYAGRLTKEKGLLRLVEDLAEVNHPYRVAFAGEGPLRPVLEQKCEEFGVHALFLGQLAQGELVQWQQRAACLLFPLTRPEPFGLSGIEAMRCGTPVVATNLGAVPEWLTHRENGMLVPYGESWAEVLEELLGSKELRERLGRHAAFTFEQQFRRDLHIERLIALFETLYRNQYAPCATDEQQIANLVDQAVTVIHDELPAGKTRALLLTGSYGKGEGGIVREDNHEKPHNDLDFLLVTDGLRRSERESLKAKIDEQLDPLRNEVGVGLVLGSASLSQIRFGKGRIGWYEICHGHQTLLGDDAFLRTVKHQNVESIPANDVYQMVVNRGTLLVINDLLMPEREAYRETIVKHLFKAIIGFGDALLFLHGRYHWSYLERARRIEKELIEIAPLYREAMGFRLQPNYPLYADRDLESWNREAKAFLSSLLPGLSRLKTASSNALFEKFPHVAFGTPSPQERIEYLKEWGVHGDSNFHKMLQRSEIELEESV